MTKNDKIFFAILGCLAVIGAVGGGIWLASLKKPIGSLTSEKRKYPTPVKQSLNHRIWRDVIFKEVLTIGRRLKGRKDFLYQPTLIRVDPSGYIRVHLLKLLAKAKVKARVSSKMLRTFGLVRGGKFGFVMAD